MVLAKKTIRKIHARLKIHDYGLYNVSYQQTTLCADRLDISARQVVFGHNELIQVDILSETHLAVCVRVRMRVMSVLFLLKSRVLFHDDCGVHVTMEVCLLAFACLCICILAFGSVNKI
jgi:hypothetical protein